MNLFLNMITRNKLLLGFGLVMLLLVGVIAIAYRSITAMQSSQEILYHRDFADSVNLMTLRSKINGERAALLNMMLLKQSSEQAKWQDDIKKRNADIDKLLQQLIASQRDDQMFLGRLKELKPLYDDYARMRDQQLIPMIYAGHTEAALALALGEQFERYIKIRTLADELGDSADRHAQEAVAAAQQRAGESRRMFVIIGIIAFTLAATMTGVLTRVIAGPLKEVAEAAGRIAAGDLAFNIPAHGRQDEVGLLIQAFGDMVDSLRKLTLDIRNGTNILASSATEILATTTQVAAGSAETATAVSETTTTVEEVRQTVQLASQKAALVSESTQRTAQISQSGRQAVEGLIAGMERIREQTALTAASIVRLSEQSQTIGEIILTVNDLAEQSNLLAVNAAIEAAKAGELGKGFAVVAQEIKTLADQSKQATTQVRVILGDIQKATGAAVMATDLSGKAVEEGARQSDAAGEAIRLLADSIDEAAQAALQIAASSQQQLVGMDQVAMAMENIKQASAQNMAGTGQAEAAAQNLHELGGKLKQLVARYKV